MFHITLLICAYFKTIGYYFCVSGIESTRNWIITYLFYFVLKFLGFSRFLFCLLLCLLIWNQGKKPPEKLSPGKKPHRKNAYSTFCISVIPPMKINTQHQKQNLFQAQTVYHFRSITNCNKINQNLCFELKTLKI